MKIEVRYQSRGGNTKAVAEAIADIVGVKSETIDVTLEEPIDLLFLGGGVYAWDVDRSLKDFLKTINPNNVKSIASFSTAGSTNGASKIAEFVKTMGINVCDEVLSIKMGVHNNALLGGKGSVTLKDKQIILIKDFINKVIK